jgi:hypothetical protein
MMHAFDPRVLDEVRFPTKVHERIVRDAALRFAADPRVSAMVLTNSLARNIADARSDVDFAVFVAEEDLAAFKAIAREMRFAEPSLEVHMGAKLLVFEPREMDWNDIDDFELRIGNYLAHSRLVFDRRGAWSAARAHFLPYYDEALAAKREARFREIVRYQMTALEIAVERGLAFEAAHDLVHALTVFFACLFVKRRTYPVDYRKRVEAQVRDLLGAEHIVDEARAVLAIDAGDIASLRRALAALQTLVTRHL